MHPIQIVDGFPTESNDLPLSCILTQNETIMVDHPPPAPLGIEWHRITEHDLEEMPILTELKALKSVRF